MKYNKSQKNKIFEMTNFFYIFAIHFNIYARAKTVDGFIY